MDHTQIRIYAQIIGQGELPSALLTRTAADVRRFLRLVAEQKLPTVAAKKPVDRHRRLEKRNGRALSLSAL